MTCKRFDPSLTIGSLTTSNCGINVALIPVGGPDGGGVGGVGVGVGVGVGESHERGYALGRR